MDTHDSQAHPSAPTPAKPGLLATYLAHRREVAEMKLQLKRAELEDKATTRQAKEEARKAKAAQPRRLSPLQRALASWQQQRQVGQRTVERQSLRHVIQAAGHEYLALLLMVAAAGGSLLFFLGRYYGSSAPLYIVIPAAAALALSIEWSTAVFGQDMQDSLTLHQPAMFLVNLIKALIAYGVSVFMLANAASVVWAPLDNLLGIDTRTWAWALAITVFGVQFLLKLSPERPKAAKNIVAVSHFVAMMAPEASPEQQIAMAARMLSAFATPEPAPKTEERPQTIATALLGNHHSVIVPREPLAPVYISAEESEGESSDGTATFRN